ncbi:PHP domain-containing protein [Trabulsiella odontotermitis]|uniref:Histidinol phosphatase n=1 Tax=Trabulsiella odontotermitis TaxID=379893 RepID=A0A0L0GWV9_9ENTR|nr:PHP domain-containing protein [Trabulsiella odontotermitis]KNC93422.1 histidinol phosphatase [Trabulsiella odontotermitis]
MERIDLHMHSAYSDDADFPVSDLMTMAKAADLTALAITDHNSAQSVDDAIRYGKANGVRVMTGIEIDCAFAGNNYHLLGYGFRRDSRDFDTVRHNYRQLDIAATPVKLSKLRALGFQIDEDRLYAMAGDGIPQEEEMAELILEDARNANHELLLPYRAGNARSDMPLINFFWDFFGRDKPCHVTVELPPMAEMAALIIDNGGIPVIAHIGANVKEKHLSVIDQMLPLGVQGVEVFSSYHDEALRRALYQYTVDNSLLATSGSDFHGKNKPNIKMGSSQPWADALPKTLEILEQVTLY